MMDFEEQLNQLVSKELALARRDPERLVSMVDRLSNSLGLNIAVLAKGNPRLIDELMVGVENYVHLQAVSNAPLIKASLDKAPTS